MAKLRKIKNTRVLRHLKIRKKISGSQERPRLYVFRSLKHIYASVIDDSIGKTLMTVSTLSKDLKTTEKSSDTMAACQLIGAAVAKKCIEKGIKKVVFDRSGYLYHGRIKALADAARKAGLEF